MDGGRSRRSRRRSLGIAIVVTALLVSGLLPGLTRDGVATVAAQSLGTCSFAKQSTKQGKVWKLRADCTTAKSIAIPNGTTVDGNGHTIFANGPASGFGPRHGIVVAAGGGMVTFRRLTVDGVGVTACGSLPMAGILFWKTGGRATGVAAANLCVFTDGADSHGIAVAGQGKRISVTLRNVRVTNLRQGVEMKGAKVTATVLGGQLDQVRHGVWISAPRATVDGVTINGGPVDGDPGGSAIAVLNADHAMVRNNELAGFLLGVEVWRSRDALVSQNRIVGVGDDPFIQPEHGVWARSDSAGRVSNNAISNFLDANGCGILLGESDGTRMTLGGNTYPAPGNTTNVCRR